MINQGDLICKYNSTKVDINIIKSNRAKIKNKYKDSINESITKDRW